MSSHAERQCRAQGLQAADVFSQQFRLSKDDVLPIEGFNQIRLGDWFLSHGSGLPVAIANVDSQHFVFLGVGVDSDGDYLTEEVLNRKLSVLTSLNDRLGYLAQCAGRYAYITLSEEFSSIHLDPVGTLGVVFDPTTEIAASTVNLALDRRLVKNSAYMVTQSAGLNQGGRFAFGHTQDIQVKRLLGNHYLNLDSFSQHRHWDYGDEPFACTYSVAAFEKQIDLIIARQTSITNAIARHHKRTILALSGGEDSRVLLACAKECLDQVELVTHAENWRAQQDIDIAKKLADTVGQEILIIDAKNDPDIRITDAETLKAEQQKYRIASGNFPKAVPVRQSLIEVLRGYPEGGVLLRGHVTDILKAVLWRNIGIREYLAGTKPQTLVGLRLMMLGDPSAETDPELQIQYHDWLESLPENARDRLYDFMGIEQFRTHGMGAEFYAFTKNFYVCPGNDRLLIRETCKLPPELRVGFHFNDMLLRRAAPELEKFIYTRPADNKARNNRRPLDNMVLAYADTRVKNAWPRAFYF